MQACPRKLIHLANFNSTNIGNGALIFGTERVLQQDWRAPVVFIPEPWDDYTFGLRHFEADRLLRNLVSGLALSRIPSPRPVQTRDGIHSRQSANHVQCQE